MLFVGFPEVNSRLSSSFPCVVFGSSVEDNLCVSILLSVVVLLVALTASVVEDRAFVDGRLFLVAPIVDCSVVPLRDVVLELLCSAEEIVVAVVVILSSDEK